MISFSEKCSILYSKLFENWQKYRHKWPKVVAKLFSFAMILLPTRSKCVLEESKNVKEKFGKWKNYFIKKVIWHFFLLKSSETYAKQFSSISEQQKNLGKKVQNIFCVSGAPPPLKPWFVRGFVPRTSHRGLRPPAPDGFGLNPPSQLIIDYHWLALLNQVRKNPRNLKWKFC